MLSSTLQADDGEDLYHRKVVTEILPDNKRSREKKEQLQAKKMKEQMQAEQLKLQQELKLKHQRELLQKEQAEQKLREQEKKKQEQIEQERLKEMSQMKGVLGNMINDLEFNETPLEYTITGLKIQQTQIDLLMLKVEQNISLRILSMCRKQINDEKGKLIAKCLVNNHTLEKVELEGNLFGCETSLEFGKLIAKNKVIRAIDLDNNDLTNDGKNVEGIQAIAEGLKSNTTLLSLSLNNCNLESHCSAYLRDALQHNQTLIMLDIEGSKNSDMKIEDVRIIQDCLKRNKAAYDDERQQEFLERQRMKREHENSLILITTEDALNREKKIIQERSSAFNNQNKSDWDEQLMNEQLAYEKELKKQEKLFKDAFLKKKKRGMGAMGGMGKK